VQEKEDKAWKKGGTTPMGVSEPDIIKRGKSALSVSLKEGGGRKCAELATRKPLLRKGTLWENGRNQGGEKEAMGEPSLR